MGELIKFFPNTKAKADEVNYNFNCLKDDLKTVDNHLDEALTTINSNINDLQVVDEIITLGQITAPEADIDGNIPSAPINLVADRIHTANINASSSIILPVLSSSNKFINLMLDFTLSVDCSLTLPNNIHYSGGEVPELIADGVTINRLMFDTTTGGQDWICYFSSTGS